MTAVLAASRTPSSPRQIAAQCGIPYGTVLSYRARLRTLGLLPPFRPRPPKPRPRRQDVPFGLTPNRLELARRVARGESYRAIAAARGRSYSTSALSVMLTTRALGLASGFEGTRQLAYLLGAYDAGGMTALVAAMGRLYDAGDAVP